MILSLWRRGEKNTKRSSAQIDMLADGSALFTKAAGLELDLSDAGFGLRSQRYCAFGRKTRLLRVCGLEPQHSFGVSSAEEVFKASLTACPALGLQGSGRCGIWCLLGAYLVLTWCLLGAYLLPA